MCAKYELTSSNTCIPLTTPSLFIHMMALPPSSISRDSYTVPYQSHSHMYHFQIFIKFACTNIS